MAEVEVDVSQVADDHAERESVVNKSSEPKVGQNGEDKEEIWIGDKASKESQVDENSKSKEPTVEVTERTNNSSEKAVPVPVPVSAHQRDTKGHESLRVKEARRWNDRDRFRHGRSNNYTPKKPYKNNNKFEPTSLPESDDPEAIRKQVACSLLKALIHFTY